MTTIKDLLSDTTRGATSIFKDALQLFLSYPDEEIVFRVIDEAMELKNQFNSMGVFYQLLDKVRGIQEPNILLETLNELLLAIPKNREIISQIGGKHLPSSGTVLTISNSSMVTGALKNSQNLGKNLKILCLRSAPANEGELLASSLMKAGIRVNIAEDESFQDLMIETDLVMLGCDLLGENYFINKRGSGSLVRQAEKLNKPVWVLGDTLRIVKDRNTVRDIEPLFERVPYSNTIKMVCEKGFLNCSELKNIL